MATLKRICANAKQFVKRIYPFRENMKLALDPDTRLALEYVRLSVNTIAQKRQHVIKLFRLHSHRVARPTQFGTFMKTKLSFAAVAACCSSF